MMHTMSFNDKRALIEELKKILRRFSDKNDVGGVILTRNCLSLLEVKVEDME